MDRARREQIVRDAFASWNSGTLDVARFTHPEGRVRSGLTNEIYEGHPGLERWMAEINDQFDRWELHSEEFHELEPDGLVVIGSISMRGRASGVELVQPVVWLFRFRDDVIFEMAAYPDRDEGLAAAGLADD